MDAHYMLSGSLQLVSRTDQPKKSSGRWNKNCSWEVFEKFISTLRICRFMQVGASQFSAWGVPCCCAAAAVFCESHPSRAFWSSL